MLKRMRLRRERAAREPMVEEKPKKADVKSTLTFLAGLLVILLGIIFTVNFFEILKLVFYGVVGPFLILVGLVMVAVAKE